MRASDRVVRPATWTYLIAALLELVFVGTLLTLPAVPPTPLAASSPGPRLLRRAGLHPRNPVFLAAITLDLFAVLLGGAVALLPIFAKDILEVGPSGLGPAARGAGGWGAVAAVMVAHLPPWRKPGQVLLLVVVGFGLATIGFGLSTNVVFRWSACS